MANKISIEIDLSSQQMTVFLPDDEILCYPISSAKNGAGEQLDSECTPRGIHRIAEKIGDGEAENTVFVGRKPTGEIYSEEFAKEKPSMDAKPEKIKEGLSIVKSAISIFTAPRILRRYEPRVRAAAFAWPIKTSSRYLKKLRLAPWWKLLTDSLLGSGFATCKADLASQKRRARCGFGAIVALFTTPLIGAVEPPLKQRPGTETSDNACKRLRIKQHWRVLPMKAS